MRKISWLKQSGRGKDAPVIGSLQVEVPTSSEIASLPMSGEGWTLTAIEELMTRATKIEASNLFMSLLKAGMSREDAEKALLDYVPNMRVVVANNNSLHRRLREQAIATALKMKNVGMTADVIADIIAGNGIDVNSVLIAVGLLEDTTEDDSE